MSYLYILQIIPCQSNCLQIFPPNAYVVIQDPWEMLILEGANPLRAGPMGAWSTSEAACDDSVTHAWARGPG